MQLPDIQFTTTSDGVTIAYWSIGSGPPLIIIQNFSLSHAELEWAVPSMAGLYTALAKDHRVIRFDPRHAGMSETGKDLDTTLVGMGHDISAVADACGLDEFALFAIATMGPVAIDYTATHPERVNHLILCDTYPAAAESRHAKWIEAQSAMVRLDDGKLSATLFREKTPKDEVDAVVALATGATTRDIPFISPSLLAWDAKDRLEDIQALTLVLVTRRSRITSLDEARRLATAIPSAQLKTIEADYLPYFADHDLVLDVIGGFLGTKPGTTSRPAASGFTTVVFTDLVASTEMMNRLGDAEGRSAFRLVEQTTAELATEHHGEVIKYTGDGSLVAFPATSGALSFAVVMQEAMEASSMELRIGMAAGEPIHEDGDLHGAVVHQASRIADQASASEIVVADAVRQLALGKGFDFASAGETTLKGFDEPVRLWKVTGF